VQPAVATPKPQPVVVAEPVAEAEAFKLEAIPAETTYQTVTDSNPIEADPLLVQQQALLAEAKALLQANTNPARALAISYHLKNSHHVSIRSENMLPLLQGYLLNQQFQAAEQLLQQSRLTDVPLADQKQFTTLAANYYQSQQQLVNAVNWLLTQDELAGNSNADAAMQLLLWQHLIQLAPEEMAQLTQQARPRAQAWLELLQTALAFHGDQASMQQAFQNWQSRHPSMPAITDLPEAITSLAQTQPFQPARLGVILPLSGPMKALGESVQLGLIAASTDATRKLIFIDSQQDANTIYQALQNAKVDFVVGPLLREDVDKVQALPEWPWPTLFLNSKPQDKTAAANQFYFALSVEDEAVQMVELFRQKQYQHPVLIHAVNPIGQRMAQQFREQWQQQNGKPVESYSYSSQDELRQLINTFLETSASTERVKELEKLSGRPVKAEMHSRLDVDAIYILADPAQTRLFKPFIDVTVSPTAPALPVYASSRSHSLAIDRTDIRDLSGMTLTEMPWLLPMQPKPALRTEYDQLFAEQDETQQRLFAMGHDAMQLISRLKQQQQFPALVFHGLTGHLRLTEQQQIQRQLTLAQYRRGKLEILQHSSAR
jgi:outer membrane PBP1 activator LpoA protein